MKTWGLVVVAFTVLACTLAVCLPLNQGTVSAISTPLDGEVKILYTDSQTVADEVVTDTAQFTDYAPLQFQDGAGYHYEGFGAYVGMQATFELQLLGSLHYKHLYSTTDSRADNWAFIDYAEPLPYLTSGAINYEQVFETRTITEDSFVIPELISGSINKFYFTYKNPGIYRVQIFTSQGTIDSLCVNTFIIVVKTKDANFSPLFLTESESGLTPMSQITVIQSLLDTATLNGEKAFALLSFRDLAGYSNDEISIIANTISVTPYGGYTPTTQIRLGNPIPNSTLQKELFGLFLVKNQHVNYGKYEIYFSIRYKVADAIDSQGVKTSEYTGGVRDYVVRAELEFSQAPKGYTFPWQTLLICVALMSLLGAGLFACNWFMKYSNNQNNRRLKEIRENREEIERQNMEKLRERVRLQEIIEQQEAAQSKKPVRKTSKTKKPAQDTE